MNLTTVEVTEVLGKPYYEYDKWWIQVLYIAYGVKGKIQLMKDTEEEALSVKVGHKFLT